MASDTAIVFARRDGTGETHVDRRPFQGAIAEAVCGVAEPVADCGFGYLLPETIVCKACARLLEQ